MTYTASVRDKQTKQLEILTYDYPTKKAFAKDLKGNGYAIRFIATEETFDAECAKWHERNEKAKDISRRVTQLNKR